MITLPAIADGPTRTARLFAFGIVLLALTATSAAQCTLLLQDDFRLVPRPKGGNGHIRDVFVHTSLNDFWAVTPNDASARWRALDGSGVNNWTFAASSLDPIEPEEPPFPGSNGTAFAQGHTTATLPMVAPVVPVTLAAEFVVVANAPEFSSMRFGFTSSNATGDNFDLFGRLWLHVDGLGRYELHAGGQASPVLTGTFNFGLYWSGWSHLALTYDPAAHVASGRVGDSEFGPVAVDLGGEILFAGMESHNDGTWWCVANNFIVRTGPGTQITQQPVSQSVTVGGDVSLTVAHDGDVASYAWRRDGAPLADGVDSSGMIVSGSASSTLTLTNVQPSSAGSYDVLVATYCGTVESQLADVAVAAAGRPGDTNCDGVVNFADIDPFVAALGGEAGYALAYPGCRFLNADTDGDGIVSFADIDPFVALLSSGG